MGKLEQEVKELLAEELPAVNKEALERIVLHLLEIGLIPDKQKRDFYILRKYDKLRGQKVPRTQVIAELGNTANLGNTQVYNILKHKSRRFEKRPQRRKAK